MTNPGRSQTPTVFRRWVLSGIGGACLAVGGALLWVWLDPDRLAHATPLHLYGLLGLFVLPSATMALHTLDRREAPDPDPAPVRHPAHSPEPSRHSTTPRRHRASRRAGAEH